MKFFSKSQLLSYNEYLSLLTEEDSKRYSRSLKSTSSINPHCIVYQEGMLKWGDDDQPERWAGAYPLNYVRVVVMVYDIQHLPSKVDHWELVKNRNKYNRHNFSISLLNRIGFDDSYWIRPYKVSETEEVMCSHSEMTEDEYNKCILNETSEERMYREIKVIQHLSSRENHPDFVLTKDRNVSIRFSGNDDCSYTVYIGEDISSFDDLGYYMLINNPDWYRLLEYGVFTN